MSVITRMKCGESHLVSLLKSLIAAAMHESNGERIVTGYSQHSSLCIQLINIKPHRVTRRVKKAYGVIKMSAN